MDACTHSCLLQLKLKSVERAKAVTAVFDIGNAMLLNLLILINDDAKGTAIAAVALFSCVLVAYIVTSLCFMVYEVLGCKFTLPESGECSLRECCKVSLNCRCCKLPEIDQEFVLRFLQLIGLLLYFYGDNGVVLFTVYSKYLGCDEGCENNLNASAKMALAVGTLFTVPTTLHKFYEKASKRKGKKKKEGETNEQAKEKKGRNKKEEDTSDSSPNHDNEGANAIAYICQTLGLIVDVDALYTLLGGDSCLKGIFLHLSYAVLGIYCVIFLATVSAFTKDAYYHWKKLQTSRVWRIACWFLAALCVLACWCHLLADNTLPLDCGVKNEPSAHLAKFLLSLVACVCATVLVDVWFACYCAQKNYFVKKRNTTDDLEDLESLV